MFTIQFCIFVYLGLELILYIHVQGFLNHYPTGYRVHISAKKEIKSTAENLHSFHVKLAGNEIFLLRYMETGYGQKVSGQKVLCIPRQKVLGIGQKVFHIYFYISICVIYIFQI